MIKVFSIILLLNLFVPLNSNGQFLNDTILANFYNEVINWSLLTTEGLSNHDSTIIDILNRENNYYGNINMSTQIDTSLLQKKVGNYSIKYNNKSKKKIDKNYDRIYLLISHKITSADTIDIHIKGYHYSKRRKFTLFHKGPKFKIKPTFNMIYVNLISSGRFSEWLRRDGILPTGRYVFINEKWNWLFMNYNDLKIKR